VMRSW